MGMVAKEEVLIRRNKHVLVARYLYSEDIALLVIACQ